MNKRYSRQSERKEMVDFIVESLPFKFHKLDQLRRIFNEDPKAFETKKRQVQNFVNASRRY
jgi:hypothetical protein